MRSGGAVLVEAAGGAAMLPLPFACRGEVVRGFGRGSRQLGVPTGEGLFAWQLSFLFFYFLFALFPLLCVVQSRVPSVVEAVPCRKPL